MFVYFDNDVKVRAPFDAERLAALTGSRASGPPQTSQGAAER